MTTDPDGPLPTAADILWPASPPRAFAIYALRRPPALGPTPASAIPSALAACGIAVLALDFPALSTGITSAEDQDAAALLQAADMLRAHHRPPALLVGHSAAGPAVLAAAASSTAVRGVATIGSPAPSSPRSRGSIHIPLLVLHAPGDPVVPVREASRVFAAARHPKSFIALDGVDHTVSDPRQARHVAGLIAAWAESYLPDPTTTPTPEPDGVVVVTDAGTGRYAQKIIAGRHVLTADEPVSVGGTDAGPNPYDLLLAALGACTSMTLRMYADRTGLPLHRTTVRLRHDRIHAKDCEECEQKVGMLSHIRREIDVEGPLSEQDRRRLVEIADRCPVHRTLDAEIAFETTEA